MGDIREINHTYRIDPRTQKSISIPKKSSRDKPKEEEREQPHDEIVLTHHEDEDSPESPVPDSKSEAKPEELPGLDISA